MTTLAISADSQAIALLCSSLAIPRGSSLKPLTPTEWNGVAQLIHDSDLSRPGALLGRSAGELAETVPLPADAAERLADLLGRGGQFALELERLSNRGIWLLTRADDDYPPKLKRRLGSGAPPLLFGAGARTLLQAEGVAIVGSRNVDEDGLSFAITLAQRCARGRLTVVSGGARGVDMTAMLAALAAGGSAVGVIADSLERLVQRRELRAPIAEGELTLISPFNPAMPFNVGNAMRRNRLIYCLADAAVVVASDAESGGTRTGALENLKARWVPLHVRVDGSPGNDDLLRRGATPITADALIDGGSLELQHEQTPQTTLDELPEDSMSSPDGRTGRDAYTVIWPLLEPFLSEPRTAKEVAETFALELAQARKWLKRASEEGAVIHSGRSYRRAGAEAQPQLWEDRASGRSPEAP